MSILYMLVKSCKHSENFLISLNGIIPGGNCCKPKFNIRYILQNFLYCENISKLIKKSFLKINVKKLKITIQLIKKFQFFNRTEINLYFKYLKYVLFMDFQKVPVVGQVQWH